MLQKQTYVGLDAIRGVAALAILVSHVCDYGKTGLTLHGAVAVDIFFMLSGFVVAHAYEGKLISGRLGFGDFVILRLKRLWPLAALGSVLGAVAFTLSNGLAIPILTTLLNLSLMMIPQVIDPRLFMFPLNCVLWSLFVELVMNFIYAGLIRRATTRRLILISGVGLMGLIYTAGVTGVFQGVYTLQMVQAFARGGFAFPLGIVLYRLRERPFVAELAAFGRRIGIVPLCLLFAFAVAMPVPAVQYDLVLVTVLAPLLLIAGSGTLPSRRVGKVATALGGLSYPLYALHIPFIDYASHRPNPTLPVILAALLSLPAAYWGWVLFDAPLQRILKGWRAPAYELTTSAP